MKIADVMTKDALTCSPNDTLDRAAQIMWDADCGALPVVDDSGRTIGIVTDRDICMAAYTQGKLLSELPVSVAASKTLISATPSATVDAVTALMSVHQIRRVPVVDSDGKSLGIVGLGDIVRHFAGASKTNGLSADPIARTLAAIAQPRVGGAIPSRGLSKGPVYRVKSLDGGWEVVDRRGHRVSEMLRAQSDAVGHAKELARRDGSAQIIVHHPDGSIASEFFYQRDERSALSSDDMVPTLAATQPVHARRRGAGSERAGR